MNIPYRTRRSLRKIAMSLLIVLAIAIIAGIFWFLWLARFVVYTRDRGAVFDMSLSQEISQGKPIRQPKLNTVTVYYNEGNNSIDTSKELTQISGYYADTKALEAGIDQVMDQIKALPMGTPIMVDVKNPKGAFYYSSSVGNQRDPDINAAQMDELIAYLEANKLYAIARLPAFRDYEYGLHHVPDGLPTSGGYLWADDDYCYWLNPTSQGTITYLRQIVTELKQLGFDEVVFDDFCFPETDKIVFNGDKEQAIATAAKTLLTACSTATDLFTVSFIGQSPAFPLPTGRSRLYLSGIAAAQAQSIAQQTGLSNPAVNLVFLTEVHDTRFDVFGVLRPVSSAH